MISNKSAFLPTHVIENPSDGFHSQILEAYQAYENNLHDSVLYLPRSNHAYILFRYNHEFRILETQNDLNLRLIRSNSDTLKVFPDLSTARRYLNKISRLHTKMVSDPNKCTLGNNV
jgi:hypothetical protein